MRRRYLIAMISHGKVIQVACLIVTQTQPFDECGSISVNQVSHHESENLIVAATTVIIKTMVKRAKRGTRLDVGCLELINRVQVVAWRESGVEVDPEGNLDGIYL